MASREVQRYIFKGIDIAYGGLPGGKLERDRNNNLVMYDKDSVVEVAENLIASGSVDMGLKIDDKNSKGIRYVFEAQGEGKKFEHIIIIGREYAEDNKQYLKRLDAISKESLIVRVGKTAKKTLKELGIGIALVGSFTGAMLALDRLTDDGIDHEMEAQKQFFIENNISVDSHGNVHKGVEGQGSGLTEEEKTAAIIYNLNSGSLSEEDRQFYIDELHRMGYSYDENQNGNSGRSY